MSAELDTIRRASALMRENAAKAEPGRWRLWGMTVMADPTATSNVDACIEVAGAYTPSAAGRRLHTGNATHIASWHPAVALAVADWLDTAGADIWAHGPLCECTTGCDACDDNLWEPHARAALALARAYLGEA